MTGLLAEPLLADFGSESEKTRRILTLLTDSALDWRPHPRSMTLGRLGTHLTEIPRWGESILRRSEVVASDSEPIVLSSSATILDRFDSACDSFALRLAAATDQELSEKWRYTRDGIVEHELSKLDALREFVVRHQVHHRGQLTVYLRLLEVPLPQTYGPTADNVS